MNSEDVVENAASELLKQKSKSLSKDDFRNAVFGKGMDEDGEKFDKLMKGNVFSQEGGIVRFQNRAMER